MKPGVLGIGTGDKERLVEADAANGGLDSDALLAFVSDDVNWPGGKSRLHGKAAHRTDWTDQWAVTRTHDEPVESTDLALDGSVVRVHQVVRALDDTKISKGSFDDVHHFRGGLIARLDNRRLGRTNEVLALCPGEDALYLSEMSLGNSSKLRGWVLLCSAVKAAKLNRSLPTGVCIPVVLISTVGGD